MVDADESQHANLYDSLGGAETCRRLAEAFYARVPNEPVLRRIYPASSHCAVDSLTACFIQLFGGPNEYSRRRYWLSLQEAHARFRIGSEERDAWLATIGVALRDIGIEEPIRSKLFDFFVRSSASLINYPSDTPTEPACDEGLSVDKAIGSGEDLTHQIETQWAAQKTLDAIVAAMRGRDPERALSLTQTALMQGYFENDQAAFVHLLAIMSNCGGSGLLEYVCQTLARRPDLVQERYYHGRTLLHAAAGAGNLAFVELLSSYEADPNSTDEFGHTPLYCAGNEQGNGAVVHALANAGADVDARDRIKRCTALHMAARRCNVPVAAALLDCGANIEAKDRSGESPLRRAVNCGKADMVAFLLSRGADPHSIGSKGLTPRQAARSEAMKQLFALA